LYQEQTVIMRHSLQVPAETIQKWREMVNLLAEIIHVPSALIMKIEPPNIRVLVSSESRENPYEPDEVACLNTGLYCETVMKTRQSLLVPDALADNDWKSNPDIKLGMISYLGFPISWPDGEVFGTICVLDRKKNEYSELYRKLLLQYRDVLQADLRSLATAHAELTTQMAHLEELFTRVPEAIVLVDDGGRVVRANPEFTRIFGYAESEVLGESLNDLIVPEELRAEAREVTRARSQRGNLNFETVRTRKDGIRVPVSVMRVPVPADAEGSRTAEYAIYRDITERKRAEETVRRSEKQLRDVIETIPAMVWSTFPDGTADFFNQRWQEFTGLSLEESLGWEWTAPVHPEDYEQYLGKWRASIAAGQPLEAEVRFRRAADGEYRWCLDSGVPLRDEQGNVLKWYGIVTDIDERKHAEGLLAGEKRILDMVARGDSLARILDSLCLLVEEQAQGVLASVLLVENGRLVHGGAPTLPKAYMDAIDGVAIGPSVGSCGTAAYRGEQVIVTDIATDPLWANYREAALPHALCACWSTPIFSPEGKVIGTFAMYYRECRSPSARDQEIIEQITDLAGVAIQHTLTEEKLRRSETYLAEAQRISHTGSWAWSPATGIRYWSEECYRILGIRPTHGLLSFDSFVEGIPLEDRPGFIEQLSKAAREKMDFEAEYRFVHRCGDIKNIRALAHPVLSPAGDLIEFVGTMIDITERKHAEETLRKTQAELAHVARVATLGELTASIAHELNQPLGAIVNNASASLRWLAAQNIQEARRSVELAIEDGHRAGDIIQRIRSFAKKAPPQKEWIDINHTIEEVIALAHNEAQNNCVSIQTQLASDLPLIFGDRIQLQQVILNLIMNAIEAMSGSANARELLIVSEKNDSSWVHISVRDSGPGLDPQSLNQIFTPFYTTKRYGMGMGLAICRSTVEAHGGRLWTTGNEERGATFQFTLPTREAIA
jgi:PAS domain S-box-containing protein